MTSEWPSDKFASESFWSSTRQDGGPSLDSGIANSPGFLQPAEKSEGKSKVTIEALSFVAQ